MTNYVVTEPLSEREASYQGEEVLQGTFAFVWDGTSSVTLRSILADDAIKLSATGTVQYNCFLICGGAMFSTGDREISGILSPGFNVLEIYAVDVCGGYISMPAVTISSDGISTGTIVHGRVFHSVDLLQETENYPLNNVKVDVTMYYSEFGMVLYTHTYSSTFTNQNGYYYVHVGANPFNWWDPRWASFELAKLVSGQGWNKVRIIFSTCSNDGTLSSIWESGTQLANAYIDFVETENLYVKRSDNNVEIGGAFVNMYSANLSNVGNNTDSSGLVQFNVYPMNVTNLIQKSGYITYSPTYNFYVGHNCQVCSVNKTALLTPLDELVDATINFTNKDSIGYYPDGTLQMEYNVGLSNGSHKDGAYIKLFKPDASMAERYPSSGGLEPYYYSPPKKNYTPGSNGMRGIWVAALYDDGNTELANDSVFFGTKGSVGYDVSNVCSQNKLTITWADIDPVTHYTPYSSTMTIKVYDYNNNLKYTYVPQSSSGSFDYVLLDSDDTSNYWTVTLIDQWNVIIDTCRPNIYDCNQMLYGLVSLSDGTAVGGAFVSIDLPSYSPFIGTSHSNGSYVISGFPAFSNQLVTCYKLGYSKIEVYLSINDNEWENYNFVLEALIKGTVIDEEGNPIQNVYVIIEGVPSSVTLTDVVVKTRFDGTYDIAPQKAGIYSMRFMKNNFVIATDSVTITQSALDNGTGQQTKNKTLVRRSLNSYGANFPESAIVYETSYIQLDEVDANGGIAEFLESGQQIALVDLSIGRGTGKGSGGTGNTGSGGGDANDGDLVCEYYGDGKYKCRYKDESPESSEVLIASAVGIEFWPLVAKLGSYNLELEPSDWIYANSVKNGQMISISNVSTLTKFVIPHVSYSQYLPVKTSTIKFYKASGQDPNTATFTLLREYSMKPTDAEFSSTAFEADITIDFAPPIDASDIIYLWVELNTFCDTSGCLGHISFPAHITSDEYTGGKLYENSPLQNGSGTWSPVESHITGTRYLDMIFMLYGTRYV